MLFNSFQFAVFFPLVTLVYFLLPHRVRWAWLLLASCAFYMAYVPAYILVLAVTIAVDYTAGLAMVRDPGRRHLYLWASLAANLGMLGFFKYFNFANANLAALAALLHWNYPLHALAIALPLGLSFHVFQSIAYTIEVYRGNQAPERHPGIFALYVMFYPQLVAGPIERPQNLLHQFHERHDFDPADVTAGLQLMAWGIFKKIVIADRIADMVAPVFGAPGHYGGLTLLVAAVLFTFQIYGDFSGYSDIALGAARVMGFRLTRNFNHPYVARSIQEFWTRWHISLSTWFNDYVFTPLAFRYKQRGKPAIAGAAIVTFGLSGLWHGAGWQFIVFGLLHGVAVAFDVLAKKARRRVADRLPGWLFNGTTLLATFAYVTLAFIFFRSASLASAWTYVSRLGAGLPEQLGSPAALWQAIAPLDPSGAQLGVLVLGLAAMELAQLVMRYPDLLTRFERQPLTLRWAAYQALVLAIVILGVYKNHAFIYFQF